MCFIQGYRLAILKILYIHMRVEQISKEIIDKDNQVFHCQKRSDKEGKPYDVRTVSKISLIHVYFHIYTARLTQI